MTPSQPPPLSGGGADQVQLAPNGSSLQKEG